MMGVRGEMVKAWIKNDLSFVEGLADLQLIRSAIGGVLEKKLKKKGIDCEVKIKELKKDRHSDIKETDFHIDAQISIEENELIKCLDNMWNL